MLELKNVSKFYYNNGIITSGFSKLNLKLNMGEFVVITGESGSGKSTLLNVLSGLDSYEEGEMYIDGKETSHYSEKDFEEYRRKYIANIFQSFNLVNSYTVYQNVELVLLLNGYKKHEVKKKILKIIDEVGLKNFKNTKVSKLSGGQKQRVAIARAIVKDTPIIVADEPTGNLDSKSAEDIINILSEVTKNKLVIIVTHNIEQFEQYATRIIKMHDGRITENREIRKVNKDIKPKEKDCNKTIIFNKYRLGCRNTFNIFTKFALLFFVFFFIVSSLILQYSGMKKQEYEMKHEGESPFFYDLSDNRVILKKSDKTAFSNDDFAKLRKMSNIDFIEENDLFIDSKILIVKDEIGLYGVVKNLDNFKGKLDVGKMPKDNNDIIIICNKNQYEIKNNLKNILNKKLEIEGVQDTKVRITGIKYNNDMMKDDMSFYVSSDIFSKLRAMLNQINSKKEIYVNGKYVEYLNIAPSDKVEKGKAIVEDVLKWDIPNGKIIGESVKINISNIYYEDNLDLKISNIYNSKTIKKLTGYNSFGDGIMSRDLMFINADEYNSMFKKPSYQASAYVKDVKQIDKTLKEFENIGIVPKRVTDFRINSNELFGKMQTFINTTVTFILVIVLFFISYFIIKIILKSRNIYYTILRMLGANVKTVKRILDIELSINSNLAFVLVITIIEIIRSGLIKNDLILEITKFIGFKEYIIIYMILAIMSRIISRRFSKKMFKKTAINTYNEVV